MKKIYSPMFSTFYNDIDLKISSISSNMIIKIVSNRCGITGKDGKKQSILSPKTSWHSSPPDPDPDIFHGRGVGYLGCKQSAGCPAIIALPVTDHPVSGHSSFSNLSAIRPASVRIYA